MELIQQKLKLCFWLFFSQRISFRCWLDEIDLVILWVFNFDEETFQNVNIARGSTFSIHSRSWQALGLHHGLSDQLKPILYPLEEKGMVPECCKEIAIKCTFFHIKPRFRHIINGVMLEIKLIDQEFIFGRLAVSVASKWLDFILDAFLDCIGWFGIKAISPLSCGDSQELFTCVENLLIVYLDVYVWLLNWGDWFIIHFYVPMCKLYSFRKRITPDFTFKIFYGNFIWRNFHFSVLNIFLTPFADTAPNSVQRIILVGQAAQI